jgi:hypothetical protein
MKTKTFFLLCLLMSIGVAQISGQNSNLENTKSVVDYKVFGFGVPVYCEGVQIDWLVGWVEAHRVKHIKDGVTEFTILRVKGEAQSTETDEYFTFMEMDKLEIPDEGVIFSHDHVKGDKGTVYNMSFFVDYSDPLSWIVKNANAKCK